MCESLKTLENAMKLNIKCQGFVAIMEVFSHLRDTAEHSSWSMINDFYGTPRLDRTLRSMLVFLFPFVLFISLV
ncbi:hypothetical protein N7447_010545 [Penicillium robsamsonii]|uniref:uncharacterized protein n=1 Tax=Penicillium robsamsonii TaxID=1792511 RepID=UPI002547F78D|nr:uncharacterized protein N7447_010545 [Penicillium robsamsonii]KAJ5811029.1 hypothetical protein N7447_010545 [Penicillium robsamsonii]